jgi:hypothetical protein
MPPFSQVSVLLVEWCNLGVEWWCVKTRCSVVGRRRREWSDERRIARDSIVGPALLVTDNVSVGHKINVGIKTVAPRELDVDVDPVHFQLSLTTI